MTPVFVTNFDGTAEGETRSRKWAAEQYPGHEFVVGEPGVYSAQMWAALPRNKFSPNPPTAELLKSWGVRGLYRVNAEASAALDAIEERGR